MKTITGQLKFILLAVIFSTTAFAQIPNASFEDWSGNTPAGWLAGNSESYIFVTPSSNSHSGSSSARLETKTFSGVLIQAIVSAGSDGSGFPVSERYGQVSLYYKFHKTVSSAELIISVGFKKGEDGIGAGVVSLHYEKNEYTPITVPVHYINNEVPDIAVITIMVTDENMSTAANGSYAEIDDISFDPLVTGVKDESASPKSYSLEQNFPNPFNPSTTIKYSVAETGNTTIKVYNILGSEIATLLNEVKQPGNYELNFNAAELPSGTYFYSIESNNFRQVKKMILMK